MFYGKEGKMKPEDKIEELELQLKKAYEDSAYWRLAYDKLLKMMDRQDEYIRSLERQTWGSSTK